MVAYYSPSDTGTSDYLIVVEQDGAGGRTLHLQEFRTTDFTDRPATIYVSTPALISCPFDIQ